MASKKSAAPVKSGKVCPVTKEQFLKSAGPLSATIGGSSFTAAPRVFESGSFGYNLNGTITIDVDGHAVECTVGCNVIAKYSKPK